jgi:peptidyl-prolyl cis-trans isomerase C
MKLIPTIFLVASAAGLLAQGPPNSAPTPALPATDLQKVVISVGDSKITAGQFGQLVEMLPEQNRQIVKSAAGRRQFADEIVRVLVLAEEGKRQKLDQTPAFKTQSQFQQENLLAGKAFAELGKVDDTEARKYFDEHKADFEQVRARHILIRAAGSPVPLGPGKKELSEAEALAKATELRKKVMDGADFAALASQESDDESKNAGGDLNFFHRGQLVPPFEQAAFAMKVGEVSEPVKTPFGYHLIKVEARKEANFEDARPEIDKKLMPQKSKGVVEGLVKKATVNLDPDYFGEPDTPPPANKPAPPPAKN